MTFFGAKFVAVCILILNSREIKGVPVKKSVGSNIDNGLLFAKISIPIRESCDAIKQAGFGFDGVYLIDPDGPDTGLDAFLVDCDMRSHLMKGYTTIHHNRKDGGQVNNAERAGSFDVDVKYDLSDQQINAIISISKSCRQFIRYDCVGSAFEVGSTKYHYWLSAKNAHMYNWGGVPTGRTGCACGLTRTCDYPTKQCNCNVNDLTPREDQGYLVDKATLPVKGLHFGDTGHKDERGFYTLGPLQCSV